MKLGDVINEAHRVCSKCGQPALNPLDPPEEVAEAEEGGMVVLSAVTHTCTVCGHRETSRFMTTRAVLDVLEATE